MINWLLRDLLFGFPQTKITIAASDANKTIVTTQREIDHREASQPEEEHLKMISFASDDDDDRLFALCFMKLLSQFSLFYRMLDWFFLVFFSGLFLLAPRRRSIVRFAARAARVCSALLNLNFFDFGRKSRRRRRNRETMWKIFIGIINVLSIVLAFFFARQPEKCLLLIFRHDGELRKREECRMSRLCREPRRGDIREPPGLLAFSHAN